MDIIHFVDFFLKMGNKIELKNVWILSALRFQEQIINRMSPSEKSGPLLSVSLCAQVLFMSACMPISARALSSPDPAVTSSPRGRNQVFARVLFLPLISSGCLRGPAHHFLPLCAHGRVYLAIWPAATLSAWSSDRFAITFPLWESQSSVGFFYFFICSFVSWGIAMQGWQQEMTWWKNVACTFCVWGTRPSARHLHRQRLYEASQLRATDMFKTTLFFTTRWNNFLLRVGCGLLAWRQTLASHFVAGFYGPKCDILNILGGYNDKFILPGVSLTNKTSIYGRNPDPFGTCAGFFWFSILIPTRIYCIFVIERK